MPRALHKLTAVNVKTMKKSGRHSDGGGLYLNIAPAGSKSWVFIYTRKGAHKRTEMGLGPFPAVSLSAARSLAEQYREMVAAGKDPKAERDREAEKTFGGCVDAFLSKHERGWKNPKHRAQWRMTLTEYCRPIADLPVSAVRLDDVLRILSPIWAEKPETASRLRGRIEQVLDFAKVNGWRDGENPARWRGNLKHVLGERDRTVRHHAALPYREMPEFMERLRARPGLSARLLEFTILTASRTGEAVAAKWSEIDLDRAIWTVPADRMKTRWRKRKGAAHRVALSRQAVALLRTLYADRVSDFVFPGPNARRPMSGNAMPQLLGRMNAGNVTVHGFRSTFRDWVGDETSYPREIAEAALSHKVGDDVEGAYRRSDAIERRRELMQAWSDYCDGEAAGKIVSIRGARR